MPLFNLFYRNDLQARQPEVAKSAVVSELDHLTGDISNWAQVQHNDDGTHNVRPSGIDFVPVGGMIRWPLPTPPAGWLLCNGAAISRTAYPLLFAVLGISQGAGDGTTTYNIPNVANFIILAA
jgi:hypothetical protein